MKQSETYNPSIVAKKGPSPLLVFCGLWVLLFLLYLPAARAGFVTDFLYWLNSIKFDSFSSWVNRTEADIHTLYQFRELVTYGFYIVLRTHAWLWHLLFITMQATNAFLLYIIVLRLLVDMAVEKSVVISLGGVLLFCISPYISEVTVWKSCSHYLMGLMMLLLVLMLAQRYIQTLKKKYIVWAMIVYFLSTYSFEIFYITPWLVLMLGLFYRYHAGFDKKIFNKLLLWFFIPELVLFAANLVVFRVVYGTWAAHLTDKNSFALKIEDFGKPIRYFFHLIFMGRFFPEPVKDQVYHFCDSIGCICVFWGLILLASINIAVRFGRMSGKGRVASLLFVWMLMNTVLMIRVGFNGAMQVTCDRYVFCTGAFFYMLVGVLLSFIASNVIRIGVFTLYAIPNLWFGILVNRYWGQSHHVLYGLVHNLPTDGDKKIILLNVPETMHGVPMIYAGENSEYKLMHDMLMPDDLIRQTVFDGMGYNMLTPNDGAHVTVLSDNKVRVTLNQFGTWWWYNGQGAVKYENEDYWAYIMDVGHEYDLTLKKPVSDYLLLYNVGDKWKVVDMSKRDVAQY